MKYSALIPVKTLALAKSRLAPYLSQDQRERLVLDMLQHVILTLCDSELFEQIYVVSADPCVLAYVQYWGAEPLREARPGHNPALQCAAQTIVERVAWRQGVHSAARVASKEKTWEAGPATKNAVAVLNDFGLLTISADLPLLSRTDVHAIITQSEHYQVVLAGSSEGTGTNALLLRPPLLLPYLFGPTSLPAYIQAAHQQQVSYTLLSHNNVAFDIDTIDDLRRLEQQGHAWSPTISLATRSYRQFGGFSYGNTLR